MGSFLSINTGDGPVYVETLQKKEGSDICLRIYENYYNGLIAILEESFETSHEELVSVINEIDELVKIYGEDMVTCSGKIKGYNISLKKWSDTKEFIMNCKSRHDKDV